MKTTTFGKIKEGSFFKLTEKGAAGATGALKFVFKKRTGSHAEIIGTVQGAPKSYVQYVGEHRYLESNDEVVTV